MAPAACAAACNSARVFAAKGDDRQVFGGGVLFQAAKGGTDVVARGFQVRQHQHRLGLLGAFHQRVRVGNGLDAIIQVLEPVDELAARQQLLIENKRERLRHARQLGTGGGKLQKNSRPSGCVQMRRIAGCFGPSAPRLQIRSLTIFAENPNLDN